MMDKLKNESSPGTPSSGKTSGFKIPKKKPDDWCEDTPFSSPLTRLQDDAFRNVTTRKRQSSSSYEAFNTPRNKDSLEYFTRVPIIILEDIRKSNQEKHSAYNNVSVSCNDGIYHINPVSSDSRSPYFRNEPYREREAQSPTEYKVHAHSPTSKVCRDVSNTSISSHKDLNSGLRKSCGSVQEYQHASKVQEQNIASKGIEASPAKREKTYCYKRAEQQNRKTSHSPSSVDSSSSSIEPPTNHTLSFSLDSTDEKNIGKEKLKETAEEHKKSNCFTYPLRSSSSPGAHSRTRTLVTNDNSMNVAIILSSDEDEAAQKETRPGCVRTLKKTSVDKKCPSPTKDEEKMDHSGILENTAPETSDNLVLQLKVLNVYYGKKKGKVSELAKFTSTSIEIPLKVPLQKITNLSVQTRMLQKYGFWLTNGGDSVRSSAVVILWVTPGHVPVIEQQMELSAKNQACKSNEFIFLELVEPLSSKEQSLLSEIMVEASQHGLTSLAEVLDSEEISSMLRSLPSEECSFKLNCYSSGSQPSEVKKVEPTYCLMQKWSNGNFSVSMVPEKHNIRSEIVRSEVPIRLLVYPPPPAKGGLAVSNEDLECLEHGEFLNDVIIDFYLKYLMSERFPKPFADRCHIFSSFFFKCLTRKENSSKDINPDISMAERRHQRVKNWTRHVDIFTKDFIFVPVNENSHWYLAVICFPGQEKALYEDKKEQDVVPCSKTKDSSTSGSVIVFNDSLSKTEEHIEESSGSEDSRSSGPSYSRKYPKSKESHIGKVCKRPCILIFDSLTTGSVKTTVEVLREYLKVEFQVKKKLERVFSRSSMRELYPKVPKQNNSTDCGLYLLQYVESFAQKPVENFEPPMHLESWFPTCLVRNKREEIRDLILRLHVEQTKRG